MGCMRYFVDVGDRQVLTRTCGSADLPPLVMMHGSPGSSYSVMALGRHLTEGRRVIAPDTPGNGDSWPLAMAQPEIGDYAEALLGLLDALELETADLYGFHTGAAIAVEFSIRYPARTRRLLLEGVSLFDPREAQDLIDQGHAPPIACDHEGTQYARAAMMVRDAHLFWPWWSRDGASLRGLGLPAPEDLHDETMEVLKAPNTYYLSYHAALRYPKRERLPLVTRPALVAANPKDQLYSYLAAVTEIMPSAKSMEMPDLTTADYHSRAAAAFLRFLEE